MGAGKAVRGIRPDRIGPGGGARPRLLRTALCGARGSGRGARCTIMRLSSRTAVSYDIPAWRMGAGKAVRGIRPDRIGPGG
eukprot:5380255-Prymnesium_polylepis.1